MLPLSSCAKIFHHLYHHHHGSLGSGVTSQSIRLVSLGLAVIGWLDDHLWWPGPYRLRNQKGWLCPRGSNAHLQWLHLSKWCGDCCGSLVVLGVMATFFNGLLNTNKLGI